MDKGKEPIGGRKTQNDPNQALDLEEWEEFLAWKAERTKIQKTQTTMETELLEPGLVDAIFTPETNKEAVRAEREVK